MGFYKRGRKDGGSFERGIESALQFILASPEFLFRVEPDPPPALRASAGQFREVYRLDDLRARVAPVVLPLEQSPRRAADLAGGAGAD